MIFYVTYNDGPSGIYSSQVIDVVKFIRIELDCPIRLVSFISVRKYFKNRSKIKAELPAAIVLPMIPGLKRWKWNTVLLRCLNIVHQPELTIARSVLATQLALKSKGLKQKVVYDGRGAIAAEWKEYNVVEDQVLLNEIEKLERSCILDTDFRIAVSGQLLEYWRSTYGYKGKDHNIIPCTLNAIFEKIEIGEQRRTQNRIEIGFKEEDIVFVYSGSLAGWQSFDLLYKFISPLLSSNKNCKVLFLAEKDHHIRKLDSEFPRQIVCKQVEPKNVPFYLLIADYGLLIRAESITNRVASPVKFAEYLACGLKVFISEHLGDCSAFIKAYNCGYFYNEKFTIIRPSIAEKREIRNLAIRFFTKEMYRNSYSALIDLTYSNKSE